jgi:hypothetical protein
LQGKHAVNHVLTPEPHELRLLAIQRQRINVLGRDDGAQERGRGLRFREDMGRRRRGLDALPAAGTAVPVADVLEYPQLGRYEVELLGCFLTDSLKPGAIVIAELVRFGEIVNDLNARQVRRNFLFARSFLH